MFSNSSPLNWHSTLRRLKKENGMGALGKELGLKNKTLSAFVGDKTTTPVIAKATQNEVKKVLKEHKPSKKLKKQIASSGSTGEEGGVIGEAVGSPAAELGFASPSTPPGMSTSDASPRETPSVEAPTPAKKPPTKKAVPSTPHHVVTDPAELAMFYTPRGESPVSTPAKKEIPATPVTPPKTSNTKTATSQIFSSPATPLGKGHGGQSKPARRVAASLMTPKSVKKLAGEDIEAKKRPEIKQRPPKRRAKLLSEILPKQRKAPLKQRPMPDPNALVPERKKRDYQKRGNKNDRVSEISERQAKLVAATHLEEIAKAQPAPVAESPAHDWHSFRKAHTGNKWTPKKMGAEWKAWKQAHPNK